jgi:hypothetical protein
MLAAVCSQRNDRTRGIVCVCVFVCVCVYVCVCVQSHHAKHLTPRSSIPNPPTSLAYEYNKTCEDCHPLSWPPVTVDHAFTEPTNSYDIIGH